MKSLLSLGETAWVSFGLMGLVTFFGAGTVLNVIKNGLSLQMLVIGIPAIYFVIQLTRLLANYLRRNDARHRFAGMVAGIAGAAFSVSMVTGIAERVHW
jgi:hypothetical protein